MVLFFFSLVTIINTIIITIMLSTIKIEVESLELSNIRVIIDKNYLIKISLNLFNKIKWLSIKLNNKNIKKIISKINIDKVSLNKVKGNIKNIKMFKYIKPHLEKLDLKINLGVKDAVITSSLVFFISFLISILLPYIAYETNKEKYKYEVFPIYNKNVYYIKLNCIFNIKLVHIINIIYIYLKERKK